MPTLTLALPRPHPAQSQVIREARRFNSLACGRRWGKTQLGLDRLVLPALDGYPVAYFSPTYRMLTEAWRQARWLLHPVTKRVSEQEKRIELMTGGLAEFWSLDHPDAARGRKYKRVVIDEAAMIRNLDEAWQAAIRPTLTDYHGDAWFLSTPRGHNFFFDLFERGQDPEWPDYASWQMPTVANPYIDPAEVEAARIESDDLYFAQEYLAAFVTPEGVIVKREWYDNGRNRYDAADPAIQGAVLRRYLSFDTAEEVTDTAAFTACVVGDLMPDYTLNIREVWRGKVSIPELPGVIERMATKHNWDGKLRSVVIEYKSSGKATFQTMKRSAPIWLRPLLFAHNPIGDKVTRLSNAAVWMRQGMVLLPATAEGARWLPDYEDELFSAPNSPKMDQVDATSQLIKHLENPLSQGLRLRGQRAATEYEAAN